MFKALAGHMKDRDVHTINALPSNNIELFDCYTGLVMGLLYRNFPLPVKIDSSAFIDYKSPHDINQETREKEERLFLATIKWLADVGYIHFDGMSDLSFFEVILTNNGLNVLRAKPEGAQTSPSIGENLSLCLKNDDSADLRQMVGEALSLGSRLLSPMIRSGI